MFNTQKLIEWYSWIWITSTYLLIHTKFFIAFFVYVDSNLKSLFSYNYQLRSHMALIAINCEFFVIYCFSSFYQILKRIYFTNFSYKLLNFFFFCRRWIHNLFPPTSSIFFFLILFYQYLQYTFVGRWIVSTQTQLSTNIAQYAMKQKLCRD